ncbi:MAG: MFS transporter [Tenericutes bacterium]|nr:MFS transporter [Mycoplasmatota bacterium]
MENRQKIIALTLTILSFMAFLANGDNYAAAPLIIKIAEDLSITISQAALSATAYMMAFGLFTILFGPLADKYGKTKIINIAAFGTALFSILGFFAQSLPYLIVVRALNGAFAAGIFPVTMALVGDLVEPNKRQASIGKVMGMMFLGGAASTLIGGLVSYFGSWQHVYLIYGVAELLLAILMVWKLPKSEASKEPVSMIKTYKTALSNKKLLMIVGIIFIMGYSVFGTFTFMGEYIKQSHDVNVLIIGLLLTAFGFGTVLGGKIAPKIKQKLGNKYITIMAIIGSISLITISLFAYIPVFIIALVFFGISFISLQSVLVMTAQTTIPKQRGTAMSLTSFNMFVGGAVATIVNGNFIATNPKLIFIIAAILFLVISIIGPAVINYKGANNIEKESRVRLHAQ